MTKTRTRPQELLIIFNPDGPPTIHLRQAVETVGDDGEVIAHSVKATRPEALDQVRELLGAEAAKGLAEAARLTVELADAKADAEKARQEVEDHRISLQNLQGAHDDHAARAEALAADVQQHKADLGKARGEADKHERAASEARTRQLHAEKKLQAKTSEEKA